MFTLHNKRFDMISWFGFPEYIFCSESDIHLFIFFIYLVRRIIRHSMTLLANFVTPKSVKRVFSVNYTPSLLLLSSY